MKTFINVMMLIAIANPASAQKAGGHDGNGGDTFLSQFRESLVIAAEALKKTERIEGVPDKHNQVFLKFKKSWIQRLESMPSVSESANPLFVENSEKAAVANSSSGSIELNAHYWQRRPVSMIQSIVLAIHETGHLENVPLSHRELDEIGFALVKQNLKGYFGTAGLKKISETHKDLSPREKIKFLFEDSVAPATLDDFAKQGNKMQECVVYPPKQEVIYSHPAWFYKFELVIAPDSPLFPGGEKQVIIISSFEKDRSTHSAKPTHHMMERTDRGLKVKFWGSVKGEGEKYQAWAWIRYEFRKNGDLLSFKMTIDDSDQDSYGYCWDKK